MEVRIATAGIALAGTACVPDGAWAAALLVPGSGKNDRDETVCGHRVFGALAEKLALRGVASLRLDDRGVGASGGDKDTCTHVELSSDVKAARSELERITGLRTGIVGHSEGATIAVRTAVEDCRVPWVVMLAGSGVPMQTLIHQQAEKISRGAGAPESHVRYERRMNEHVFANLRAGKPVVGLLEEYLRNWPDAGDSDEREITAHAHKMAEVVSAPAFVSLLDVDPGFWLERVQAPVLALTGALDWQVSADDNLPAIRAALARGGCPTFRCEVLPQLNHLFQSAETGALEEYASLGGPMTGTAVDAVTAWLASIVAR